MNTFRNASSHFPAPSLGVSLLAAGLVALGACSGEDPENPVGPAVVDPTLPIEFRTQTLVELAPGTDPGLQLDSVFATLKLPFVVRVIRDGQPVEGAEVAWTVDGGSLSSPETTTDADGLSATVATLSGPRPAWLTVEASVEGAVGSPVRFFAAGTAGQPARVQFDRRWRYDPDRNGLTADGRALVDRGTVTPLQYGLETTDRYGNIVLGVRVDFEVVSGGGSVSPRADTTAYWQEAYCPGSCLSAFTTHQLGSEPGPQSVTATASELPGAPQLMFTSIPVDAVIWYPNSWNSNEAWSFSPSTVSLKVGATVGWRLWYGTTEHNVVFEDDPTPPASSGLGGLHTRTFTVSGTYRYRCTLHSTSFTEGEVGEVVVLP